MQYLYIGYDAKKVAILHNFYYHVPPELESFEPFVDDKKRKPTHSVSQGLFYHDSFFLSMDAGTKEAVKRLASS